MIASIYIEESQFQFSASEYKEWGAGAWHIGDDGKFDKMFRRIGCLNRGEKTYENQAKDNQVLPRSQIR